MNAAIFSLPFVQPLHAILFLVGLLAGFGLAVWLARPLIENQGPDWRKACGREQHRGDQWKHLFERQRHIEDLSPAAARQEQFDIDRRARVLGHEVQATRRAEP